MAGILPRHATTRNIANPDIYDQGQLGSCTQNGGAGAMAFIHMKRTGKPDPHFSRLFGYFYTRKLERTPVTEDSGCQVRDVFKTYRKYGLCLESTWAYDMSIWTKEPSPPAVMEALHHRAKVYYACTTLHAVKKSIADGYPVIFGFDCFESLDSASTAKTGFIPLPRGNESSIGGHCMLIDSYDDDLRVVGGHNSWGTHWGDRGCFTLPYDYFTEGLASDAHTLRDAEVDFNSLLPNLTQFP